MNSKKNIKTKKSGAINLIYGSILLVFFLYLILFGPEKLPGYKHNLIAIISSLLVGIFGFFLTGDIGLKINTTLFDNKFGKMAIQATGGIALFVLCLLWWKSPNPPIKLYEEVTKPIIDTIKSDGEKTRDSLILLSKHIDSSIQTSGEKLGDKIDTAAIAQLESLFPFAVRLEVRIDNTILRLDGRKEIPVTSYENTYNPMILRWGDTFEYYPYSEKGVRPNNENSYGLVYLKLSNQIQLNLELKDQENSIMIPGHGPEPIHPILLNPDGISGVNLKIMIYSSDSEVGRERFKNALMNSTMANLAKKIYREITADGVKLRSEPNLEKSIVKRVMLKGTYLKVIDSTLDFYKIYLPEGRDGWVKKKFVQLIK